EPQAPIVRASTSPYRWSCLPRARQRPWRGSGARKYGEAAECRATERLQAGGTAECAGSLLALGCSRQLQDVRHGLPDLLVGQFTFELRHGISPFANLPLDRLGRSVGSPASVDEIGIRKLAGGDGLTVAVRVVAGGAFALENSPAR